MARVFVSYCHSNPDESLAASIVHGVQSAGHVVFWDKRIVVGMRWSEEIERQIGHAEVMIVLISETSIRSDMVRREIASAHDLNKRILPVRVDFDGTLPYDLASYLDPIQYVLWRREQPHQETVRRLVEALRTSGPESVDESDTGSDAEGVRALFNATEGSGAPLPACDPRFITMETGTVHLSSPFYVERDSDRMVKRPVGLRGETLIVKGPRQSGKSSLLARLHQHCQRNGHRTFYLDLQLVPRKWFDDLDTLLQYFARKLWRTLRTPRSPDEFWDEFLGGQDSLQDFMHYVLSESEAPLIVLIDEVDRLFEFEDYREEFFAMIRGWHNLRATTPEWGRLDIAIAHSTEPYLWIQDINQSPFNVGLRVALTDFTFDEVRWLNERYGSVLDHSALRKLTDLIGGHPYLMRRGLHTIATEGHSVASLHALAADEDGPFGDHLRRLNWALHRSELLQRSLKQIITRKRCDNESHFQILRATGIISGSVRTQATVRCKLYGLYFGRQL